MPKAANEDPTAAAAKRLEQDQEMARSKLADPNFNPRRYGDPLAERPTPPSKSPELEQKWLQMLRAGRPSAGTT